MSENLLPPPGGSLQRLLDTAAMQNIDTVLRGVDAEIAQEFGHLYITISVRMSGNLVRRVYSAAPEVYPVGEMKDLIKNIRVHRLLNEGIAFIANSPLDLRQQYVDPDVLERTGVTSLANLPIRFRGGVIGVLNVAGGGGPRAEHFLSLLQPYADLLGLVLVHHPFAAKGVIQ